MPVSYSPLLRLAEQGTGDNPSTWGQVANQQVFELVEQAISGYLTLDVTSSTNITLSVGNGVTDQARNAIIELSGFLTDDINIFIPTITKKYIIYTTFSGTNKVTVKTTSGAGITMGTGEKHFIFCDGLDVVEVIPPLGALASLDTITSAGLLDTGVVTTSAIATGAVTTSAIASAAVGLSQLDPSVAAGILPSGVPLFWLTSIAPVGYSLLDGTTLSRTGDGANLYALWGTKFGAGDGSTTFNKPDWRDVFIRGWSVTSTVDPDGPREPSNTSQLDAFQGHIHGSDSTYWSRAFATTAAGGGPFGMGASTFNGGLNTDGSNGTPRVSRETRPVNKVSYFIVKL